MPVTSIRRNMFADYPSGFKRKIMSEILKSWKNKTILVAEDEDMNFLLIEEVFRKSDIRLIRAENGADAVSAFEQNPDIALILMDIKMPDMTGYEATSKIKAIRNVPVIAQTAYASANEELRCKAAGCDAYLTKPIQVKVLLDLVQKFLNN